MSAKGIIGAILISVVLFFKNTPASELDDAVYCEGYEPPPPVAECPFLLGNKAECVSLRYSPWVWGATSWDYTAAPDCVALTSIGSHCFSEEEAWDAWASHIPHLCETPSLAYSCTKVLGSEGGIYFSLENIYEDASVRTRNSNGQCINHVESYVSSFWSRMYSCPPGYLRYNPGICYRIKPEACPAGNPIQCAGGQKVQVEADISRSESSALEFVRYYSSSGFYTSPNQQVSPQEPMGANWRHSWQSAVVVDPAQSSGQEDYAYVVWPNGDYRHFHFGSGAWSGRKDKSESLYEIKDNGVRTGWKYVAGDESIFRYSADGTWLSLEQGGKITTLTYSDISTPPTVAPWPGLLVRVTDAKGRALNFRYDSRAFLVRIIDSSGKEFGYRYSDRDAPNFAHFLQFVDNPDGAVREYRYNEVDHISGSSSGFTLLTGIIDENGQRYGTYKYDTQGRAYQEYHGSGADLLNLTYNGTYTSATGSTIVVTSAGQIERRRFIANNGILRDAGTDRCATANCSSITRSSNITYDANGNRDLVTDFNGVTTDYGYNTRGQETSRIEAANTSGTTSPKRTIETQWHADFRVPVSRTTKNASGTLEAKTTWAYNTRGQATARCEIDPADPAAMSYACSATSAPPVAAKVRRTVTTYCEPTDVTAGTCPLVGLVTSVNGPRPASDAGMAAGQDDRTAYTYYASDDASCASNGACPHRKGDLWKVTNALGQVTTYVSYDKNGRVTRTQDANGTVTDFVYHVRGWLTDRIVRASAAGTPGAGDAATHIDYDAVGNVKKVIQPDGAFLAYTYDDAHRLIKIADNQNNTIDYCPGGVGSAQCLDAAGNRRVEQVKDPSGTLKRSLSRSYNSLSQLVRLNNAAGAAVEQSQGLSDAGVADGYDGNGNRVRVQDGLGIGTKQRYDGLNRLVETLQNYGGTDAATANASTGYVYDTRDNLRQVIDPDGLNTVYDYDGLNNLTGLHSPDTGDSSYGYDLAGNRRTQTDARGVTSTYAYDALNRLTAIGYPTATLNVGYAYDQSNAVTGCAASSPLGRLTTMTDASGSTTYCYDRRGNVTRKKQVIGSTTLTTDYAYSVADRLASITYPSGAIVAYARDALGRVTAVTWKANAGAAATTVVSNASYYPFGPLNVLTYGNGRTLSKLYDQDYAIDAVLSSGTGGLALNLGVDVMGNIVSAVKPGDLSRGPTPIPTQYAYDPLYRLKDVQQALTTGTLESYTYNKTGDRLSAQLDAGPVTAYAYTAGSHRLASVGGVARTYDANGNTQTGTAPGRSLTYDDRNRLTGMSESGVSAEYKINGRGERVVKTVVTGGGPFSVLTTTLYLYDEGGRLLGDYGAGGSAQTEYVYLDGAPIAAVKGGSLAYIETDHLGTPRVVADPATNAARWAWNFFGDTFGADAPDPSPGGAAAYVLNLRFPGQYYDAETGLSYNYRRDYDPTTGRYVESDPVGFDGGINTYLYADAGPLGTIDPNGLGPLKLIKLCAQGYKELKLLTFPEAVKAARKGEDVLASSHKEAKQIARAASESGKRATRDTPHGDGYMPHYHPSPRTGGHVFYQIAAALTFEHYVQCQDCLQAKLAWVGDFFNPFSTPQDLIDLAGAGADDED